MSLPWCVDRLPKTLCPEQYNLLIQPDIDACTFTGDVHVVVNVSIPHNVILMHAVGLTIKSTRVFREAERPGLPEEPMRVENAFEFAPKQYWVVSMGQAKLGPGTYTIHIGYTGRLSQQTVGLYRSTYRNQDGEQRHCVLSYFEPTYARHVFPCFDEPYFKAKFSIQLIHPSLPIYRALSNTVQDYDICDYPLEGLTSTNFTLSPKMSTYLVCFVIGEFESSQSVETETGFNVSVYSRPSLVQNTILARDLALKVVQYFGRYFCFDYPLPKLDLVAIPNSHISAMENWGLITFRESVILLEEGDYSCSELQRMVQVVSHELAHMWFGNLVTITWWDNLWLKEGFATFLSYLAGVHAYPEWSHEWVPILNFLHPALESDAHLSSHKLIQSVTTHHEIRAMFDDISYKKGASLLRMLEDLNPQVFRSGLASYVNKFKFATADSRELWSVLEEENRKAAGRRGPNCREETYVIPEVMSAWTEQTGYPVVNVTSEYRSIVLTQERFLFQKNVEADGDSPVFGYTWDVPIRYTICSENKVELGLIWLKKHNPQTIYLPYGTKWIKLNRHQVGYYRVNYTAEQWAGFAQLLVADVQALDVEDRASLLDDAFSLANAGYADYAVALNLASYLGTARETHFLPWSVVSRHLSRLHGRLLHTNSCGHFKKFIQSLLEPSLSSEIWKFDGDVSYLNKKLNVELLEMACWAEDEGVLRKVREIFDQWLNGHAAKPHPDIRKLVYKYGLSRKVSEETWEKVWGRYLAETKPAEKNDLLFSLASVNDPVLVERLLCRSEDTTCVSSEVYFQVLRSVADNYDSNRIAWDYVRNKWEEMVEKFTLNDQNLANIIPCIAAYYSTDDRLKEIVDFFEKYPEAGCGVNARKRALETVANNIKWHVAHYVDVERWLQQYTSKM